MLIIFSYSSFLLYDHGKIYCYVGICSGYGIAAQALTAVIRAHDGRGPQTKLTKSILDMLELPSPDELIGYLFNF